MLGVYLCRSIKIINFKYWVCRNINNNNNNNNNRIKCSNKHNRRFWVNLH